MKYFRNQEEKYLLWSASLLSGLVVLVNFLLHPLAGWTTLLFSLTLLLLIFCYNRRRYQKIEVLTQQIDQILHHDFLAVPETAEGELAILANQIRKMTLRLQEQTQYLQKEKKHLSSSLTDIAHQLRTPLTTLTMIGDFLSEPALSDSRRQELTLELRQMLQRIDRLITILLKIAKLEGETVHYQDRPILVKALLEEAIQPFLIPMELKEISYQLIGPEQTLLTIDPTWTTEALGNIIKNCVEHSENKGSLCLAFAQNALYTEITISDAGDGIAPQDLPHIFERFYQGRNHHKSSFGVGLSLARMIITQQGGTITAGNKSTGGAVFTIRFYKNMFE